MLFPYYMGDAKRVLQSTPNSLREKVDSGLDTAYSQVLSQPKTTFILLALYRYG